MPIQQMSLKKPRNASKPLILVAEDLKYNMVITTNMLTKLYPGAIIIEAYNGEEAVTLYHRKQPDLVLMDINMPVKSGVEAIKEIRTFERGAAKKTPILALTAETQVEGVLTYIQLGVNDIIAKPTKLETLKEKLAHFLPQM